MFAFVFSRLSFTNGNVLILAYTSNKTEVVVLFLYKVCCLSFSQLWCHTDVDAVSLHQMQFSFRSAHDCFYLGGGLPKLLFLLVFFLLFPSLPQLSHATNILALETPAPAAVSQARPAGSAGRQINFRLAFVYNKNLPQKGRQY